MLLCMTRFCVNLMRESRTEIQSKENVETTKFGDGGKTKYFFCLSQRQKLVSGSCEHRFLAPIGTDTEVHNLVHIKSASY